MGAFAARNLQNIAPYQEEAIDMASIAKWRVCWVCFRFANGFKVLVGSCCDGAEVAEAWGSKSPGYV